MPVKLSEGKVSWMNEMERVSCSLSLSKALGLIMVSVDREIGARSQHRALLGPQVTVGHHLRARAFSSSGMGLTTTLAPG